MNTPLLDPENVHLNWVLAPNAGGLQLRGTYSYILSAAHTVWVIDPGPEDRKHAQAVVDAVVASGARRVGGILLTHHHVDHTGALPMVRRALSTATGIKVPVYAAAPERIPGAVMPPAQLMAQGARVADLVHLPGHTPDSVGLLVAGGRMLTGDALLGGSSGSLGADGNLHNYLQSLRILQVMNQDGRISALYPGHGEIIDGPAQVAAEIKGQLEHRLERIEQVRSARARGKLTIEKLLVELYEPQFAKLLAQGKSESEIQALMEGARRNLKLTLEYLRDA